MKLPTLDQFETGRVEAGAFSHQAHVYIAWCYLRRYELLDAIQHYRAGLRRLVHKFGAERKYNETVTWFYMISIAERMENDSAIDWGEFKECNSDLFSSNPSWVGRHYSPERLASEQARRQFVLPDT